MPFRGLRNGAEPRHHTSLSATCEAATKAKGVVGLGGTAEQAAEKLVECAKSLPQALKRGHIFSELRHE